MDTEYDFSVAAQRSEDRKKDDSPVIIRIKVDPDNPDGTEAERVALRVPTAEQVAVYASVAGAGGKVNTGQFFAALFHFFDSICLDDGWPRLKAIFEDPEDEERGTEWLGNISRVMITAAASRPTEPSSDSSPTSEIAGRSSTATSARKASTRSRSTRAVSGT